ncbi:hypothetical protein HDU86_005887 [Geranomyces michiganensis]|nr:hypothetical protein HDU86_005887 [Geranomyces michiganensis]
MVDDRGAGPPGFNELVALDRGFKAVHLEEKLQSVLKYIPFFSKYKSSDIVTAGCLEDLSWDLGFGGLIERTLCSNNVVRQYIFKVIKHSQSALSTITSAEEVARRISKLLTSNDAVARALTLRVLGFMSVIVVENIEVHHGVRLLLDSKEPMELGAALFAADRIAFRSKTFASNHMDKLRVIMEGLRSERLEVSWKRSLMPLWKSDSDIDRVAKSNVIKVYRHMYHTPHLVTKARQECLDYLAVTYSDIDVLNILHTLSILACRCVSQIVPQIQLLLKHLETDARGVIQYGALKELAFLARTQAHHFQASDSLRVLKFGLESSCEEVRLKAFSVIVQLTAAPRAVIPLVNQLNSLGMINVLRDVVARGDRTSFAAASVLCIMSEPYQYRHENENFMDVDDPNALLMQRLMGVSSTVSFSRSPSHFRYLIGTIMRVSTLNSTVDFWSLVFDRAAEDKQGVNVLLSIAVKHLDRTTHVSLSGIESLLRAAIKHAPLLSPTLLERVILVTLRSSHANGFSSVTLRERISTLLTVLRSQNVPAWHFYEIGVEALCDGFPDIAQTLFLEVGSKVETELTQFWLTGLQHVAEAYSRLQNAATSTSPAGNLLAPVASELWRAATAFEVWFYALE